MRHTKQPNFASIQFLWDLSCCPQSAVDGFAKWECLDSPLQYETPLSSTDKQNTTWRGIKIVLLGATKIDLCLTSAVICNHISYFIWIEFHLFNSASCLLEMHISLNAYHIQIFASVLINSTCPKVTCFGRPDAAGPKFIMNSSLHVTEPQEWEQRGSNWQLKMSFFLLKPSCDMQHILVM